jgi:hypothetical protein
MKRSPRDVALADGRRFRVGSPETDDAGALLTHMRLLFHEAYRNLNFPAAHFDGAKVEDQAKRISDFNASTGSSLLVASHDGRIVGNLALMEIQLPAGDGNRARVHGRWSR